MGRIVVVGEAKRHLVGQAADAGGLLGRQVARRMWQGGLVALQAGSLGREHHLQVRLLGERARRVGEGALEGFGGGFRLGGHGSAISGL